MNVSVVVINYNDQYHLDHCIRSLLPQLSEKDQLIVVDDGSSPKLDIKLDPAKCMTTKLYLPRSSSSSRARARNRGAEHAINDYIIFFDGDAIVQSATIDSYKRDLTDDNIVLGLRCIVPWDTINLEALNINEWIPDYRLRMLEVLGMKLNDMYSRWTYFVSHNFACSKEVFNSLGKMDENFIHWGVEDLEFGYRAAKRAIPYHLLDCGVIGDVGWEKTDRQWCEVFKNIMYSYDKHRDPMWIEYASHGTDMVRAYWLNGEQYLASCRTLEQRCQLLWKLHENNYDASCIC